MIASVGFVAVPSSDADRSGQFRGDVLGLPRDSKAQYGFWVGGTCVAIWEPDKLGRTLAPTRGSATWRSSAPLMGTT